MNSIRNRILGDSKTKELTEEDIITYHHELMVCYGWIPLEEFKKIPIPMLWNLIRLCQKDKQFNRSFMYMVLQGQGFKSNQIKGMFK